MRGDRETGRRARKRRKEGEAEGEREKTLRIPVEHVHSDMIFQREN